VLNGNFRPNSGIQDFSLDGRKVLVPGMLPKELDATMQYFSAILTIQATYA